MNDLIAALIALGSLTLIVAFIGAVLACYVKFFEDEL